MDTIEELKKIASAHKQKTWTKEEKEARSRLLTVLLTTYKLPWWRAKLIENVADFFMERWNRWDIRVYDFTNKHQRKIYYDQKYLYDLDDIIEIMEKG